MKKFVLSFVAVLMLSGAAYADVIKVSVNGLVCAFCATGIEKTFKRQAAVESIKVDLENKLVTIGTKPNQSLDDTIVTKLITNAGYSITGISRSRQ